MKKILLPCLLVLGALAAPVHAADKTAQQSLMATCNKNATGKTGEERKTFMSSCLSNKQLRQQEKMKLCNANATGKTGDVRKSFMSECLKN
jgi:ABC-type transporter MlaC component